MAAYSRLSDSDHEPSDVHPRHSLPDHALVAIENQLALRQGGKGRPNQCLMSILHCVSL